MARRLTLHDGVGVLLGHPLRRIHVLGDLDDVHAEGPGVADAAAGVEHAPLRVEQVRMRREAADLHARLGAQVLDLLRVGVEAGDVAIAGVGEQAAAHEEARLDALVAHLAGGLTP